MMKKLRSFFWLLLLAAGPLQAQRPMVSAAADKQQILIGEQLQLVLKAVVPRGAAAGWFAVDTIPHFEVLQSSRIDSQLTDQGLFLQQTLTLTSWDSGRWQLPPLALGKLRTAPIPVSVAYSPMDPNQPYHDIKDILDVQKPEASNWWWYLLGVAVLIALFLLFFPPTEKKTVAAPAADPYEEALERLQKLDPASEPKLFYSGLTDLFRRYLERRKGLASLSKTTGDLSIQLRQLPLPQEQYYELVQVLQLSDAVKFARFQPQRSENEKAKDVIQKNLTTIEKS